MISGWVLIGVWVVIAFVMAAVPSTDNHWRRAYVLIALGLPALVWIFWHDGLWMGLVAILVGVSVLRWPVYYLWRRIKTWLGTGGWQDR